MLSRNSRSTRCRPSRPSRARALLTASCRSSIVWICGCRTSSNGCSGTGPRAPPRARSRLTRGVRDDVQLDDLAGGRHPPEATHAATRASVSVTRSPGARLDSRPRRQALSEDRLVAERRLVDDGRQPLPLPERADPAEHVARRAALRQRGRPEPRACRARAGRDCAATGTMATESFPSCATTSVLKTRAGSTPVFSAASNPYEDAAGSCCAIPCSVKGMPACCAATTAGVIRVASSHR